MGRDLRGKSALFLALGLDVVVSLPQFSVAQGLSTVSVTTLQVPDKAWRHFGRAKAAADRDQFEDSERELLKAIEIAPRFAEAYLLLACDQLQEHKYDAALASIQTAHAFDPGARWSEVLQASALNGQGRYADAKELLIGMHSPDAESWQAAYERARAEIGLRNLQEALQWSETALEAAPRRFADAHLVRANALLLARRWSDAITQMEAYLGSGRPQLHRASVLTAMEKAKFQMRQEEIKVVASK